MSNSTIRAQTIVLRPTTANATDSTSGGVDLAGMPGYSIHVIISGSDVAGTVKLQVSNVVAPSAAGDWIDLANSSQAITASANYMYNNTSQYNWVRAVWTHTSGTGNVTIIFFYNGVQ